jgi:hypothetical protein
MASPPQKAAVPDALLQGHEITRESIAALIQVAEKNEFKIPWWLTHGLPAIDAVAAVFEGPASKAGGMVEGILAVHGLASGIRIFPNGIPPITLVANVRIEVESSGAPG